MYVIEIYVSNKVALKCSFLFRPAQRWYRICFNRVALFSHEWKHFNVCYRAESYKFQVDSYAAGLVSNKFSIWLAVNEYISEIALQLETSLEVEVPQVTRKKSSMLKSRTITISKQTITLVSFI